MTSSGVAGIVDADFTGVTNIQTLTAAADKDIDYSLGSLAAAAGVTSVVLTGDASGDLDSVTLLAGFTNDLTIDLDLDTVNTTGNTIDATAYTKSLTVTALTSEIDNTSSTQTITGGTGTDTLLITSDLVSSAAGTPDLSGLTKFEKITVANDVAINITLSDANVVGTSTSTETITVDTTAMATQVATINAAAENDGKVVINSGAAADVITVSTSANYGDSITSGAGNDSIRMGSGHLTSADTIAAGAGTDSLIITADQTIADDAFTNVTGIETLDGSAATIAFTSLTLGTEAAEAGVTTVNLSDTETAEKVTLAAGFTKDVTIVLDGDTPSSGTSGTNNVDASAYTAGNTVTIQVGGADLENGGSVNTSITGGAGTEILEITGTSTALVADDFDQIVDVDTIKLIGSTATSVTLADESASYTHASLYGSYTVDASALGAAATIDATEEADGKLTILGGASGDTITATQSANFGDSINGGAGDDTIKFGANAHFTAIDSIDGGAGNDTLHFAANATLTDALFANVSNIKTLAAGSNIEFASVTLGANANAAGVNTMAFVGDAASALTLGSGYTGTMNVTLTNAASINDSVDASGTAGTVNASHTAGSFNSADTIAGGTGTSDKITITASEDSSSVVETADISNVSGVETIVIASGLLLTLMPLSAWVLTTLKLPPVRLSPLMQLTSLLPERLSLSLVLSPRPTDS